MPRLWATALAAALAAVLAGAPTALAAPLPPALSGTSPDSPGLSLTPVVLGSTDGVIISSFPGLRTNAILSDGDSELAELTVHVYPSKSCDGPAFGSASGEEFDDVGIQVTVAAETTTWISADVENEAEEVSNCSNAISYQQVKELPKGDPGGGNGGGGEGSGNGGTIAPPDPPHLRTVPGGLSNRTTPLVTGSAPGANAVRLYGVANCSGSPLVKLSPAELASGVEVRVTPNAVTAFSAVSVGDGGVSACSTPAFYTQDSIAPRTRITMGPAAKTRRRVAVFRFTDVNGALPGTKFFCKVNKRKWAVCKSPMKIKRLRPRKYVFRVMAVDPAGNQDAKPAKRRFRVVRR